MQRFAEKLHMLRTLHGVSQNHLAIQIGCTRFFISAIETGRKKPSIQTTLKIADFFNVPVETLIRDELDLDTDDEPS